MGASLCEGHTVPASSWGQAKQLCWVDAPPAPEPPLPSTPHPPMRAAAKGSESAVA